MARYRGWLAGAGIVGILLFLLIPGAGNQPRYAGRTVGGWFEEWLRAGGGGQGGTAGVEGLAAKTALVHLGTNAVPFLVEQAFLLRRDFAYRSNLHELTQKLPRWLGRGRFVPYDRRPNAAVEMLGELRPPAPLVWPLISAHLAGADEARRNQAIYLLGRVNPPLDQALPPLVEAATQRTNSLLSLLAIQSLWMLGPSASNALPALLPDLQSLPQPTRFIQWLGRLGPAAAPAVPWLEMHLTATNTWHLGNAAVALRRIQPSHRGALDTLARLLADTSPLNGGQTIQNQTLSLFFTVFPEPASTPDPGLAQLIAPLAEAEMKGWGPGGGSYSAVNALATVDPERALALAQRALNGPGATHAAGLLLRQDRNHARATEVLSRDPTRNGGAAIWWLGEASATNQAAIDCLETLCQPPTAEPWREAAAAALARLRYREALEVHRGR